jgi:hypothetical protein
LGRTLRVRRTRPRLKNIDIVVQRVPDNVLRAFASLRR